MNPFREALEGWTEGEWCKGILDDGERTCVLGRTGFAGFIALEDVVVELFPDRCSGVLWSVPNFNDHPDTTFEDVVQVLEKAAVRWDEQQ